MRYQTREGRCWEEDVPQSQLATLLSCVSSRSSSLCVDDEEKETCFEGFWGWTSIYPGWLDDRRENPSNALAESLTLLLVLCIAVFSSHGTNILNRGRESQYRDAGQDENGVFSPNVAGWGY
jgi:hypothetical protein